MSDTMPMSAPDLSVARNRDRIEVYFKSRMVPIWPGTCSTDRETGEIYSMTPNGSRGPMEFVPPAAGSIDVSYTWANDQGRMDATTPCKIRFNKRGLTARAMDVLDQTADLVGYRRVL